MRPSIATQSVTRIRCPTGRFRWSRRRHRLSGRAARADPSDRMHPAKPDPKKFRRTRDARASAQVVHGHVVTCMRGHGGSSDGGGCWDLLKEKAMGPRHFHLCFLAGSRVACSLHSMGTQLPFFSRFADPMPPRVEGAHVANIPLALQCSAWSPVGGR